MEISGRTEDVKHGDHTSYFFADIDFDMRDLFAAFALTGFVWADFARTVSHPDAVSIDCYRIADAMVAQRSNKHD